MDFVKNLAGNNQGQQAAQQQPAAGGSAQNEDYVDKGLDFGLKKTGHGNISRDTQEKITDAGRNAYEKVTGNKVNPKISN